MKDSDKEEIAKMIADSSSIEKPNSGWFMKLGWVSKSVMTFVAFCVAVSTLGTGISWFMQVLFQPEISQYENYQRKVDHLIKVDSLLINSIELHKKELDKLTNKDRSGSKFFAVGYRAEKKPDGRVVKYYRDWEGNVHQIFPDPNYSTSNFTYWFFNEENGSKIYTFGR